MTRSLSSEATAREVAEFFGVAPEEPHPTSFWQTPLGTVLLSAIKDLFAEETSEIERARTECEYALKAHQAAQRDLVVVQNRLAACEAALSNLPHEVFENILNSDEEAATNHIRKERERLLAEQGRLRERLIEAKAHAAKAETNERRETDRFARRARRAQTHARTKRNEVHDRVEQMFKAVDEQFGEAWLRALAPSD